MRQCKQEFLITVFQDLLRYSRGLQQFEALKPGMSQQNILNGQLKWNGLTGLPGKPSC
jgi:hypothetical protein